MIPWTRRIQSKQAVGETWDTTQPTELPSSSGTGRIQVHKEFLLNRTKLGLETGGLVESTLEKDWRVLDPFHMAGQLPRPPWLKTIGLSSGLGQGMASELRMPDAAYSRGLCRKGIWSETLIQWVMRSLALCPICSPEHWEPGLHSPARSLKGSSWEYLISPRQKT